MNGLPDWLDGALPRQQWFVRLVAMSPGEAMTIYTRSSEHPGAAA